jgi:hypothetical protein
VLLQHGMDVLGEERLKALEDAAAAAAVPALQDTSASSSDGSDLDQFEMSPADLD